MKFNIEEMRCLLGVFLLWITLLAPVKSSFIYGQPCTELNTAYLRIHKWTLPKNTTNCVDVTGFKMRMHKKLNMSDYTEFFQNVSKADTLYADHVNILNFPVLIVKSLPNVKLIDLSGNRIKKIPIKMYKIAPKVTKLLLSDNQIMIPKRTPLTTSETLQTLMLSNNGIKLIYKHTFKKLPNLEVLYLDNNKLTNINPIFGVLPNLKFLHIGRNSIQPIPDKHKISENLRQYITKSQLIK